MKKLILCVCMISCVGSFVGCASVESQPITVETTTLQKALFTNGYATVGKIKPQTQVDVVPKYAGTVEETYKNIGDRVTSGEKLLQLATTPIDNQIQTAQAGIEQAKAGIAQAGASVALANASVAQAQKGVEQANSGLNSTKINAVNTEDGVRQQTLLQYQSSKETAQVSYDAAQTVLQQRQKQFWILQLQILICTQTSRLVKQLQVRKKALKVPNSVCKVLKQALVVPRQTYKMPMRR